MRPRGYFDPGGGFYLPAGYYQPVPSDVPIADFAVAAYSDEFEHIAHPDPGSGTLALEQDQAWETGAPHTLSVVEMNSGGYKYWGYYGITGASGGPVGLAYSNDLLSWTKEATNPVLTGTEKRWPAVLMDGGKLHMVLVDGRAQPDHRIDYYTSTDGLAWTFESTLIPNDGVRRWQNPHLFRDPADNGIVLSMACPTIATGTERIVARRASTVAGLADAVEDILLESADVLAAPAITYFGGYYWLYAEDLDPADDFWRTIVLKAEAVTGPYTTVTNGHLLGTLADQEACARVFMVGSTMYLYTCHLNSAVWDLHVRSLSAVPNTAPTVPVDIDAPWRHGTTGANVEMAVVDSAEAMQYVNPGASTEYATLLMPYIKDFEWTMRIKKLDAYVHIIFRRDEAGEGYRMWIGDTNYECATLVGGTDVGKETVISSGAHGATWNAGWNDLVVRADGTSLIVTLNSVEIMNTTNSLRNHAGHVGLILAGSQGTYIDSMDIAPL